MRKQSRAAMSKKLLLLLLLLPCAVERQKYTGSDGRVCFNRN
jgi:hypothetical protein